MPMFQRFWGIHEFLFKKRNIYSFGQPFARKFYRIFTDIIFKYLYSSEASLKSIAVFETRKSYGVELIIFLISLLFYTVSILNSYEITGEKTALTVSLKSSNYKNVEKRF